PPAHTSGGGSSRSSSGSSAGGASGGSRSSGGSSGSSGSSSSGSHPSGGGGGGSGIRANRFGDRATLRRASPRPIKTYIPLQQGTQSLLHARQANVIPA